MVLISYVVATVLPNGWFSNDLIYKNFKTREPFLKINFCIMPVATNFLVLSSLFVNILLKYLVRK